MFRLGELKAGLWVAKGEENRARYGFADDGYKMTIELRNGDKTTSLGLEFGGRAPSSQYHYALATVDGQSWPRAIYAGAHAAQAAMPDGRRSWADITLRASQIVRVVIGNQSAVAPAVPAPDESRTYALAQPTPAGQALIARTSLE